MRSLTDFPEEYLRVLLESMADFLLEVDSQWRILFISRYLEGHTPEAVLGTSLLQWVDEDQRPQVREALQVCFERGQQSGYQIVARTLPGGPYWFSASISPIKRDGKVISAVIVSRDITQQILAQEALAASEARWRTLVENMPDYAVLLDAEGLVLFINRPVRELGFDGAVGRSAFQHLGEEEGESLRQAMALARTQGTAQYLEAEVTLPSGKRRWYSGKVAVVPLEEDPKPLLIVASDMTDRFAAEAELQEGESRLRQVIDLVPQMIFARNLEGRFRLVNRATAEAYGASVEELTGRLTSEFHASAEELEIFLADDLEVNRRQQSSYFPRKRFTNARGELRLLQTHKIPFTLRGTNEPLVLGVAIDVTEQERAREALEISEDKYRSLVENINDIIYTQDTNGFVTYISPVVERLSGYTPAEVVGHSFLEYVHPDDIQSLLESRQLTLEGNYAPAEFRVFASNGEVHHVRTSSRLTWDQGEICGLSGVLTDISEQKRAEQALRESELRYRSIYNLSPLVIMLTDDEGRVVEWNRRAEELFGWTREQTLGKYFIDFGVAEECREEVREKALAALRGHPGWIISKNLTRDGRILICEWNSIRADDTHSGRASLLSVALDVTQRHLEQEQQRKLEEQIQHTQKLESLGVLAGGIAHDFNNLLVGIMGNADFALDDLPAESPVRAHLDDVITAANRAADLCRQLLAYSGKGRFVVVPLDLRELVQEMAQLLELTIARKAVLQLNFAPILPAVEADPTQLRQVIMNLISNAAESFENRTGTIRVTINTITCDTHLLSKVYFQDALPEGDYVLLEVADDGCGMSHETQQRIFEPFFTTKFVGRGLGLAAVLGIVRSHGGGIKVYSELDRGTCVQVYLPSSAEAAQAALLPQNEPLDWQGEGLVLIIDDEVPVLDIARKMFERSGFTVLTAEDGATGLQLIQKHHRELTLVMLDLTMPQLTGQEILRRIRGLYQDIPVLLTSGYNEEDAMASCEHTQPNGFLQKPYSKQEFIAKVKAAIGFLPD